jgi:hypothetical protein
MNKKTIFVLLLVAVATTILIWRKNQPNQPIGPDNIATNPNSVGSTHDAPMSSAPLPAAVANSPAPRSVNADSHQAELMRTFTEEMRSDPMYMFKVPISFYGKVLDQDENPVAEASIEFSWNKVNATNNEMESGTAGTSTDDKGLFSLENQKGGQLMVKVTKAGYYNLAGNPCCFEYAQPYAGNFYVPDPNNPVVFHLKKRGVGVALITSQNGMRSDVKLLIPKDGTLINVDFLQRKAAETGPLQIAQVKPTDTRSQDATEWSFQMTIPDGGFVEYHDEFPFEAPDTGYQPTVRFDFQKGQPNWTDGVKADYYIRFGNPPLYGRLHLETGFDEPGARLTYAINPDGSRNLEPAQ